MFKRVLSAVTVVAAVLVAASPVQAASEEVRCGKYMGNHGWQRAHDGSGYLSGTTEEGTLYYCPESYGTPVVKGYCTEVNKGSEAGKDYCAL